MLSGLWIEYLSARLIDALAKHSGFDGMWQPLADDGGRVMVVPDSPMQDSAREVAAFVKSNLPQLRFAVGDRVEASMGTSWEAGVVSDCWVTFQGGGRE